MVLFRTPFRKRNWLVSAWNRSGTVVLHPDLHIDRRDLAFSGGGKVERDGEGTFVSGHDRLYRIVLRSDDCSAVVSKWQMRGCRCFNPYVDTISSAQGTSLDG